MTVKEEITGDVAVVSPQGKIYNVTPIFEGTEQDIGVYRELKKSVERLIVSGVIKIVLDMGGVSAIDSGGLGGIVSLRSILGKKNGRLVLCNLTGEVQSIFELTELIDFFEVRSTREEALAALSD